MFKFVLSRLCLTELKERPICPYVKWANTCEASSACAHCKRLSSTKLTIDYYHDFAYWQYIHAPSEFRRLVRETVRELYADFLKCWISWASSMSESHMSRIVNKFFSQTKKADLY